MRCRGSHPMSPQLSREPLQWRARLRILRAACRALLYLHTPSGTKGVILHRDIKPANVPHTAEPSPCVGTLPTRVLRKSRAIWRGTAASLHHRPGAPHAHPLLFTAHAGYPATRQAPARSQILLDDHGNARLADVGLAVHKQQSSPGAAHHQLTSDIKGTLGYIDPIYMQTGVFSATCDAYAMGVTMLVVLTGKDAQHAMRTCQGLLEDPALASTHADVTADWPSDGAAVRLATVLATVIQGLVCGGTQARRMPLHSAVSAIEELADDVRLRPGMTEDDFDVNAEIDRECQICMAAPRCVRFACGARPIRHGTLVPGCRSCSRVHNVCADGRGRGGMGGIVVFVGRLLARKRGRRTAQTRNACPGCTALTPRTLALPRRPGGRPPCMLRAVHKEPDRHRGEHVAPEQVPHVPRAHHRRRPRQAPNQRANVHHPGDPAATGCARGPQV